MPAYAPKKARDGEVEKKSLTPAFDHYCQVLESGSGAHTQSQQCTYIMVGKRLGHRESTDLARSAHNGYDD